MRSSTRFGFGQEMAAVLIPSMLSLALLVHVAFAEQEAPPSAITQLPAVLTLKDAIAIALRAQPQQAVAKAAVESALGYREEARSQYFPTVTPSYVYENNQNVEYGAPQTRFPTATAGTGITTVPTSSGDSTTIVRGGGAIITLKQTIIDSGQRELANAAARQQLESASFTDDDTSQQIIANVTSSFYGLLEAADVVKVAQALVTENQQTVDLTEAELSAGTAAQTDVYLAKANLATAQVTLIQDQNQVRVDTAVLKDTMGIVTDDPVKPQSIATGTSLPPAPVAPAVASLNQYYKIAQQNRNDLRAQVAMVDSARDAVKLARINAGVSVSADYLLTYQPDNDIGPKGTDSALTVTGSFPLLDGGYARGAVRVADAALSTALATMEQTRQTILESVEEDYSTRQESLQAITYAQTAVDSAQVNYNAAVASRKAGVGTVLEITTAEATLAEAQSQYVSSIYNYYIADSNLSRAAGL